MTIARCALEGGKLISPFLTPKPEEIINPAEDFTISINTVSQKLYHKYKSDYKAGEFDNNFFVLLSQVGIGNISKPILKLHLLNHIDSIDQDITDLWAENVEVVEDFCADLKSNQVPRVYLSFVTFCQSLGGTSLDKITKSFQNILKLAGGIFPNLAVHTAIGSAVVEGVNNILRKMLSIPGECKTVEFNLYPAFENSSHDDDGIAGEAPLQTGAYVFFFEDTDFTDLRLDRDGIVRSSETQEITPYIVVNIKKGITLAPGQLNTNAGAEVMANYQHNYGYPLPAQGDVTVRYFDALQEFGSSYQSVKYINRYYQLKAKGEERTAEEDGRLAKLKDYLSKNVVGFDAN